MILEESQKDSQIEKMASQDQSKPVLMKHQREKNKTILGKVTLRALQHQPVS